MQRLPSFLSILAELGKVRITSAVSLSTFLGYVMYTGRVDRDLWLPVLGIFLLAMASSALNHYQESEWDARMDRTRNRPIPSGRLSARSVLWISLLLALSGGGILYLSSGFVALQLGLMALLWYNAVYTPLKRKTAFAVVPGSLIGAIPPVVGWVAAGGSAVHPAILMVAFFFFIWQIPHFWLLMIRLGPQYEQAGFPSLSRIYSPEQIRKLTFVWIFTAAVACLFIPAFGSVRSPVASFLLLAGSMVLVASGAGLLFGKTSRNTSRLAFLAINLYLVFVIVVLSADALL